MSLFAVSFTTDPQKFAKHPVCDVNLIGQRTGSIQSRILNATQICLVSKRYLAQKCPVLQVNKNALSMSSSSRGRVVKALDSKSNGVSPRRFESCRLRNLFGFLVPSLKVISEQFGCREYRTIFVEIWESRCWNSIQWNILERWQSLQWKDCHRLRFL